MENSISLEVVMLAIVLVLILIVGIIAFLALFRRYNSLQNRLQAPSIEMLEVENERIRGLFEQKREITEENRAVTESKRGAAEDALRSAESKKEAAILVSKQTILAQFQLETGKKKVLDARKINTDLKIIERQAKINAGIDPDVIPKLPKTTFQKIAEWPQKHWFISFVILIVVIILANCCGLLSS